MSSFDTTIAACACTLAYQTFQELSIEVVASGGNLRDFYSMPERIFMGDCLDCVVVGAGVIGLATGRALALAGHEVVILEAERSIGIHASSRNSEVVHAGIYYPDNSLKATLCVLGKRMLYAYCEKRNISHRRIGKLIVAVDGRGIERLEALRVQGQRNGVDDLIMLGRSNVRELEPAIQCTAALYSPSTGILDSHAFMLALQADIEELRGAVVYDSGIRDVCVSDGGFTFDVGGERLRCRTLVNAAGLWATELARDISEKLQENFGTTGRKSRAWPVPISRYAKGHYFTYTAKSPFAHLIYPLPTDSYLGIHTTSDLSGGVRFGPDFVWTDAIDYAFDESRKHEFISAVLQYYPDLDEGKLLPGYTGIRPKLRVPGMPEADFVIEGETSHGIPGLVNLLGIDSPGLTASLAIGDYVKDLLQAGRGQPRKPWH